MLQKGTKIFLQKGLDTHLNRRSERFARRAACGKKLPCYGRTGLFSMYSAKPRCFWSARRCIGALNVAILAAGDIFERPT